MSNIAGLNGLSGTPHVGRTPSGGTGPPSAPAEADKTGETDKVEISSMARYLGMVAAMPEIRAEKVDYIRQAIQDGSYDIEGRLSAAIDQLIEENVQE